MMILIVEGVEEIWKHHYSHGDTQPKNIMIRFARMEECNRMKESETEEESAKFDVIDGKKCVIWDKKYLVFVDPYFMTNYSKNPLCGSFDLYHAFDPWKNFKVKAPTWFHDSEDKRTKNLIAKVDKIMAPARVSYKLSPSEAHKLSKVVLQELRAVHKRYPRIRRVSV